MVSQYTLTFAEFLKNKIETTIKGRATHRNFVQAIPLMLDLIQLVDPERISIITVKSILDSVHRCEHQNPKPIESKKNPSMTGFSLVAGGRFELPTFGL